VEPCPVQSDENEPHADVPTAAAATVGRPDEEMDEAGRWADVVASLETGAPTPPPPPPRCPSPSRCRADLVLGVGKHGRWNSGYAYGMAPPVSGGMCGARRSGCNPQAGSHRGLGLRTRAWVNAAPRFVLFRAPRSTLLEERSLSHALVSASGLGNRPLQRWLPSWVNRPMVAALLGLMVARGGTHDWE